MFEEITHENKRGQVGIGTLIVFIAMVLVAAIAAGVLINTAGSLQSQASDTGTETQQAVANQIEVVHAVGHVGDGDVGDHADSGEIGYVDMIVKKSAGSDVIDLTSVTVQYTSDSADATLKYDDNYGNDAGTSFNGFISDVTFATIEAGQDADEGDNTVLDITQAGTSLTDTGDRVIIRIDVDSIEGDYYALESSNSATVVITDQSGAQFSYGITTPPSFVEKDVVVV
ncbi:archaellin/type IV pilin N-terminal domain-containing protein [Natronoglomus mannanivorans]|uniref:Flagellin n=1 Tax=Natronoglomus mannanivorans TaxID=2979990 RepID=A0AAP2Z207_9EURY|nr:archaeal flagellin-like protein [Halobacteria archaeon AArc-xg1-1]